MIINKIKADLNIVKGKIKQQWGKLTGDDIYFEEGMQDEYLGRIQKDTVATREAVEKASQETLPSN